ncbi:MAG: membrane protein insertase YidC [Bacteroidia bacterium]
MDKNAVTGIILITLLTFGWFYFFAPKPQAPDPVRTQTDTVRTVDPVIAQTPPEQSPVADDSAQMVDLQKKYSDLYTLVGGEGQTVEVKTDRLTVNIDTRGGQVASAYLNEYRTFDSLPLPIVAPHDANAFYFEFPFDNRAIKSTDLVFQPSATSLAVGATDTAVLTLRAQIDENRYIEQVYTFRGDAYDFGYEIHMKGLRSALGNTSFYDIHWLSYLPKTELSLENMRQKTSIVYRLGNDVEKMSPSDDTETEKLEALVKWVSYKSQFFSHILIAEEPLRSGSVTMRTPIDPEVNRVMQSRFIADIDQPEDVRTRLRFYMGPNEFTTLRSYKLDLEDQLDLGWPFVAWINKGTTYIFKFLEKYISNYGIIIIILAFLIRILTLPFSYKSYVSMAKMRVINQTPEMKALEEKYKNDPQKLQVAKMGIYKEMGASMLGGCLPMLLSYPFLIALFFFFPQSVELRQQPFLWANDLSTYDSILNLPFKIPMYGDHVSLFTLLMAISTFVYTYFQQQSQPTTGGAAAQQMKYISYFMPIFLLVFLNNYSAGLSLYYLTSNILQILQTTLIRQFLDDEKLLAKMREFQKQSKSKDGKGGANGAAKKSRLEIWLESQQKRQQEAVRTRQQEAAPNRRSRRNVKK